MFFQTTFFQGNCTFQFGTGGAGICLSQALIPDLIEYAGGDEFAMLAKKLGKLCNWFTQLLSNTGHDQFLK